MIFAAAAILYLSLLAFLQSTSLGLNCSIPSIRFLLHRHNSIVQFSGEHPWRRIVLSYVVRNQSFPVLRESQLPGEADILKKMKNTLVPLLSMGPLSACKGAIRRESFYTRHRWHCTSLPKIWIHRLQRLIMTEYSGFKDIPCLTSHFCLYLTPFTPQRYLLFPQKRHPSFFI